MNKNDYKNLSKQLKSLGFINYDLRHNLSKGQKAHITKLAKQYHEVLEKPEQFQKVRLGKSTIKEIKKAETPIITNDKYALVHKGGKQTVKIKTRRTKSGKKYVTITRISKGGVVKTSQRLWKPGELQQKLDYLSRRKLKPGELFQARIGTSAPFKQEFTSIADLNKYLSNWKPKDKPDDEHYKSTLISEIQVTTVIPKIGPRN